MNCDVDEIWLFFSCWEDSVTVGLFINRPLEDGTFSFEVSICFVAVISKTKTGTVQGQNYSSILHPEWQLQKTLSIQIYMIQNKKSNKVVPVSFGRNQKPQYYELVGLSFWCMDD